MLPKILPAHTGIRGIAALFVMMFHFTMHAGSSWHDLDRLFRRGYLGVDLFFLLSGFIIHHVYHKKFSDGLNANNYLGFLRFRLARIYPVHIVTMAVALCLSMLAYAMTLPGTTGHTPSAFGVISAIFLINGWINVYAPNDISWSVSAEWCAYLCYPLLIVRLANIRKLFQIISVVFCLIALSIDHSNNIIRVLSEFTIGVSLYELMTNGHLDFLKTKLTCLFAMGIIFSIDYFTDFDAIIIHVVLFSIIIASLVNPADLFAKLMSSAVMIYMGEISYSLYMVHSIVRSIVRAALTHDNVDPTEPRSVAISVVLAIAAAAVLYHAVEVPGRQILRGRERAKPPRNLVWAAGWRRQSLR